MSNEETKSRIIEKMLRNRVFDPDSIPIDGVIAWFPPHKKDVVQESAKELVQDLHSPIEEIQQSEDKTIRLKSDNEAVEYLSARNHRIPFGFRNQTATDDITRISTPTETSTQKDGSANFESNINSSKTDLLNEIQNLESELESMEEAQTEWKQKLNDVKKSQSDWHSESRKRQRISTLCGVIGFVAGIITSGFI